MSIFTPESSLNYCRDLVLKRELGHYLHSTFIPENIRSYYFVVHAIRLELLKARESVQYSTLISSKLEWWVSAFNSTWEGSPPQEPLSVALLFMRNNTSTRKSHFDRMIRGRLEEKEIRNWELFDTFIDNNYTMPFYLTLELCKLYGEEEFKAATFAGRAWGIYKLLVMTNYYLDSSRCYFPDELLKKYNIPEGITYEDPETHVNNVPEEFWDVVLEVATYGKKNLEKAREMQNDLQSGTNLLFLPLVEAESFYNRLEYFNFNILDTKPRNIPWTRVFLKMIRCARKGIF